MFDILYMFPRFSVSNVVSAVQCSVLQPRILISRLLLHMRGKYVASIILELSASLHGRHVQKSSGVEIVAIIIFYLH